MNWLKQFIEKGTGWVLMGEVIVLTLLMFSTLAQPSLLEVGSISIVLAASTATATETATPLASPTAISTPDISDWGLYENTEHGFRLRYPLTFIESPAALRGAEILYSGSFYNPEEYDPAVSTEFNAIGIHVLANPEKFLLAQAWADAHTLGTVSANEKELQFLSYEIIESFPVNGQVATHFTTLSIYGNTSHRIFIPLTEPNKVVLFYFYDNMPDLESIALTMATTLEDIHPTPPTATVIPT